MTTCHMWLGLWPECYDFDADHAQGMTMPATARPMSH